MPKAQTYYDMLGVSPDAEPAVIEAAYRALIKKYHPDRQGGGAERAAQLNEAFSILRDPAKRKQYDRDHGFGAAPRSKPEQDRERYSGDAREAGEGPGTKECPDCGEIVRRNARVCRFCGFEFWRHQDDFEPESERPRPRKFPLWQPMAAVAGALVLLLLLGMCSSSPESTRGGDGGQLSSAAPDTNTTDENASTDAAEMANTSTPATPGAAQWSAYDEAESNLTNAYRALMAQLPQKERLDLRTGERAWIANRNRVCGFETRGACATTWTMSRAKELDRQWVERFMPQVGQCFSTTVAHVSPRLEGGADTDDTSNGAAIAYQDGHYQVDYDSSPSALGFNVGDVVRLCVVALPSDCPPGDHRGVEYEADDLVTGRTFKAADSEHMCGGA